MATDHDDMFDDPASGDMIEWAPLNRRLLLIKPHELIKDVDTKHGISDAIRSDVHVLQETDAAGRQSPPGEVYRDCYVFPKVLQGQIRRSIETKRVVIGRLGQGKATKGDPPWQLADPTDADRATARAYWAKVQDATMASPSENRASDTRSSGGSQPGGDQPAWGGGEPPF